VGRNDGSDRQVTTTAVDDSGSTILHVDMDAFYVSVELLERPDLIGKPTIVGHPTGRSVVTSASYEARRRGVRSAMPMSQAMRLCPEAVILIPHFSKYTHFSRQVMTVFEAITPLVEQVSIDEAFLDVAGARKLLGSPTRIAEMIRERVRAETGLPCSVGVASTKFVAKLASGRAKPDGLLVIPESETVPFLHRLPAGALWGVGASTQEKLSRYGLRTVKDIAETPVASLRKWLGDASGVHLHNLAHGIDLRSVTPTHQEKSVGHEITFEHDVTDPLVLRRELLRLANQTGERLRRSGIAGRTIALKLRYSDFRTVSRSRTIADPTNVGRRIYDEVVSSLDAELAAGAAIRLIGVRVEQLKPTGGEEPALWDPDEEWRDAELAIDEVSARFGRGTVRPASLVGTDPRKVGDSSTVKVHEE
jgi:DNA polymerase-4